MVVRCSDYTVLHGIFLQVVAQNNRQLQETLGLYWWNCPTPTEHLSLWSVQLEFFFYPSELDFSSNVVYRKCATCPTLTCSSSCSAHWIPDHRSTHLINTSYLSLFKKNILNISNWKSPPQKFSPFFDWCFHPELNVFDCSWINPFIRDWFCPNPAPRSSNQEKWRLCLYTHL